MITVRYSSIDYFRKTRKFKTLEGARKFAVNYVGENPDMGSHYAVSFDGVGKITVDGCTLNELFYGKKSTEVLPYEVWATHIDEQGSDHRDYRDSAFATLAEANLQAEEIERYSDGVRLVGTTDDAKAEIAAQMARWEAQTDAEWDAYWTEGKLLTTLSVQDWFQIIQHMDDNRLAKELLNSLGGYRQPRDGREDLTLVEALITAIRLDQMRKEVP